MSRIDCPQVSILTEVFNQMIDGGLALRLAKETQKLSLSDLQSRTGMDRAQLSRLFSVSAATANPTIQTLERVAAAFGKRVVLSLQDA